MAEATRKPLCGVHLATSGKRWCVLPAVYVIRPEAGSDAWLWGACGNHLAPMVRRAPDRTVRVTTL